MAIDYLIDSLRDGNYETLSLRLPRHSHKRIYAYNSKKNIVNILCKDCEYTEEVSGKLFKDAGLVIKAEWIVNGY